MLLSCLPFTSCLWIVGFVVEAKAFSLLPEQEFRSPFCRWQFSRLTLEHSSSPACRLSRRTALGFSNRCNYQLFALSDNSSSQDGGDWLPSELIQNDEHEDDSQDDWTPDRVKAKQAREEARIYVEKVRKEEKTKQTTSDSSTEQTTTTEKKTSAYTEEEEEIINAMGGRTHHPNRKREQGFLGDSTLREIATDYSVPVCYLADVLCMWGVPVPINIDERLGDLVTGEQAFAVLEAVNSLDVSALHDRYSNQNLMDLCYEWDIDLQQAFEMAMKEGWSLPFGVQTCLRVEQEDELIRVLGDSIIDREM